MTDRGWVLDNFATMALTDFAPPTDLLSGSAPANGFSIGDTTALPVYDTSPTFHACAATAAAGAIQLVAERNDDESLRFRPSVRYLYYTGRYLQMRELRNDGASIFATLRAAQIMGFCPETAFPLEEGDWNDAPPLELNRDAATRGVVRFFRLPRDAEVLKLVLSKGYPILLGAHVDSDVLKPRSKPVPYSLGSDNHCFLAVGYSRDNGTTVFHVHDSLGQGHVEMPEECIGDPKCTDDFWVITEVTSAEEGSDLDGIRESYARAAARFRPLIKQAYGGSPARTRPERDSIPILERITEFERDLTAET